MTNSEKPDSGGDQGPDISEHLKSCPDCRQRSEQLGKMIDSLSSHKELFCPEPWELYVLAESGEQPSGPVAEHLRICCDCRAKLAELKADQTADYAMPPVLVEEFRKRFPPPEKKGWLETLHGLLFSSFKFPALALATAAAAVVLVVVLQPRPQTETFIALSPKTWDDSLRAIPPMGFTSRTLSLMSQAVPKAAILVVVQDSRNHWPQVRIDGLYEAMKPSKRMMRRFKLVSPSQVKHTLEKFKVPAEKNYLPLLGVLISEELGAAHTFVFTIAKEGDGFDLQQDVVNAKTGESLSKTLAKGVKQSELVGALREAAQALAKQASPTAN